MSRRALIVGVGNVFYGDDGFGVEVAWRLARRDLPAGVCAADFGVRGLHLAYELLSRPELLVVVDVAAGDDSPGTLSVIAPSPEEIPHRATADGHGMSLPTVFAHLKTLGGEPPPVRIVGCAPASLEAGMALSDPVQAAVEPASRLALDVVRQTLPRPNPRREEEAP